MGAAEAPITIAANGVTKPAAGVIATRPTTAPTAIPNTLGLLSRHESNIQTTAAAAAAVLVLTTAVTAIPSAASALPPLKPNQPTQSSPAPATSSPTSSESAASASPAAAEYTLDQVATHNSSGDCWTAIQGKVYDLTDWEDQHPGGAARIQSLCGIDGTSQFLDQHEGDAQPESVLAGYQIGVLVGS